MDVGWRGALGTAPGREPWHVRIRDTHHAVLGAGVLLANDHVLTCAHVIEARDEVFVDFVGLARSPRFTARIECCVAVLEDRRGDIALLQLDQRQADGVGATLRRTALSWDRAVRICGFPRGLEDGVWTRATLAAAAGPGGEWLQMNGRSPVEQRVRAGFSGAGVIDEETGDVLGIVVGEYTDEAASLSWMIPVETIVHHIPRVTEWVTGDSAADEVFSKSVDSDVNQVDLARDLVGWLAKRDTGDTLMIIVGAGVSVLHRAVALSSREQQPKITDPPEGTVPALGSIDLALDTSGKTVDETSRRIINRAGIPLNEVISPNEQLRTGIPPMTIVVDGVDYATQPEVLLNEVFKPLAERGCRLVLGFRDESSPSLAIARSWDFGSIHLRLGRLAERIDALDAAERRLMTLRCHVDDHVTIADRATRLRLALSALRKMAADSEPESFRQSLEKCEQDTARVMRRTTEAEARLKEGMAERDELRELLEAYKAQANDEGLIEDIGLAALYRKAHDLLWRSPTNLPDARRSVRDYRLAVRNYRLRRRQRATEQERGNSDPVQ